MACPARQKCNSYIVVVVVAGAGGRVQAGGAVQGLPLQCTQALLRARTARLYRYSTVYPIQYNILYCTFSLEVLF